VAVGSLPAAFSASAKTAWPARGKNHCRFSRDLKVGLVPTDRDVPFHQGEGKNKIVPLLFFIASPSTMFRAGASNKKV
jgi:hypothetical protein